MLGLNRPRGRHPPAQSFGGVAVWSTLWMGVQGKFKNLKILLELKFLSTFG